MSTDDSSAESGRPIGGRELAGDRSSFVALSGHFYRAEVTRATTWRRRLDQTTHWAVLVLAALLTWVFSSPDRPHYILVIGMLVMAVFLLVEAHRYREYDVWRSRVRLLQQYLFADMYAPRTDGGAWQAELGSDLRSPSFTIPYLQAVAHRLRRVYLALFAVLVVSWGVRISVFVPDEPWYRTAAIPGVHGPLVLAGVVVVFVTFVVIASLSHGKRPVEFRE